MIKAKTIALAIPKSNRRVALAVLAAIGATIKECAKAQEPEWQSDYAAKLRRAIVRDVWEPDLRAELVDRCVNLVATKRVTLSELKQAIADAKEKRRQYELTGGKSGAESIWKPLGAWCRGRYEAAGIVWTKTDKLLEPEPPRSRPAPLRAVDVHGNPVE